MAAIDYNRGVLKRKHPAGIDVYMYHDQPGVFLDGHGRDIGPDIAEEAGYPVEDLLKEKARRDRVSEATAAIDEEFAREGSEKVVDSIHGYKIVNINGDRHIIKDQDGNVLTGQKYLTLDEATRVANKMKPLEVDASEDSE